MKFFLFFLLFNLFHILRFNTKKDLEKKTRLCLDASIPRSHDATYYSNQPEPPIVLHQVSDQCDTSAANFSVNFVAVLYKCKAKQSFVISASSSEPRYSTERSRQRNNQMKNKKI